MLVPLICRAQHKINGAPLKNFRRDLCPRNFKSVSARGAGRVSGQGGQNSARSAEKNFRLPTLVFSLPTLPCVTVAHPAHRTEAVTNQEGPLPSPPSDLALQLGLVIHTPGL